jgi:membrane fusion protein (multidrug efflux system)
VAKDSLVNNPKMGKDSATKKMPVLLAHQKKVVTGQTIGPNVVIKSGIAEDDRIIVDGLQSLHEGSKITTANKAPGGKGGKGGK